MYYITETINYFWYLLGYGDENSEKLDDFVILELPHTGKTWGKLIENIKKDKNAVDFPLHHDNEKLKIKPLMLKKKIKKKKMS